MEEPEERTEPGAASGDEQLVREQEEAAAREAAEIAGGPNDPEEVDEAERPLREAGQGEAEGFELAERDLIEHAGHGDPAPDPEELAGDPEEQAESAAFGEADQLESED